MTLQLTDAEARLVAAALTFAQRQSDAALAGMVMAIGLRDTRTSEACRQLREVATRIELKLMGDD